MPITQSESGLSLSDWNYLNQPLDAAPAWELVAHRWNTMWEAYTSHNVISAEISGYIYYTTPADNNFNVRRYELATGIDSLVGSRGDSNTDYRVITPSIVPNGGTFGLFTIDAGSVVLRDGISIYTPPNNGPYLDLINYYRDAAVFKQNFFVDDPPIIFANLTYQKNVAGNAADRNLSSFWQSTGTTGQLTVNFTPAIPLTGPRATHYAITSATNNSPRNWILEGSNDGSSWSTIDTVTAEATFAATPERRVYQIDSPNNYRWYRLNISAVQAGGTRAMVHELEILQFALPTQSTQQRAAYKIAGATFDRCYIIEWDDTFKIFQLKTLNSSSSWIGDDTGFATPHLPSWMDVYTADDGWDYILLCVKIPGANTVRTQDTDVIRYHIYDSALYLLKIQTSNNVVDDAMIVDRIPGDKPNAIFARAWLQKINNRYFITTTLNGANESSRLYASSDLKHWTKGQVTGRINYKLYKDPNGYILSGISRTHSTQFFGESKYSEDISDRLKECSISHSPSAQMSLILKNDDGYFDSHAWINASNLILFEMRMGYQNASGDPVLVDMPSMVMETFEPNANLPIREIRMTARDFDSLMSDTVEAEEARIWETHLAARDEFESSGDSNYGGLSHSAIQSGTSWTTEDGILVETPGTATREVSVIFNTFTDKFWNGETEIGFTLHNLTDAYAGIVFRAQDKDNMLAAIYEPASDTVKFYEYRGGYKTLITTTGTISSIIANWKTNATTQTRYMRLRLFHNLWWLDFSENGVIWISLATDGIGLYTSPYTHESWVFVGAENYNSVQFDNYRRDLRWIPFEQGYVGVIAY